MNIFTRELKANRKSLIIWCACMAVGVLSGMAKYTAYSGSGASPQVFDKLPQSMRALLGMGSLDVSTMPGFFGFLFFYIAVAVAFHAALLGSGILAKEERDKTTEFLYVKPVPRAAVISAKFLAALMNILILNLVTLVCSIGMVNVYNKGKDITGEIVLFFVSLLIIQLIFLSLGAMVSAVLKNPKSAGSISSGIVLMAFLIDEITNINSHLNALNLLSPFKYFSSSRIIAGNGFDAVIVLLSVLLAAVFTVLTYFFYRKRDLNV